MVVCKVSWCVSLLFHSWQCVEVELKVGGEEREGERASKKWHFQAVDGQRDK